MSAVYSDRDDEWSDTERDALKAALYEGISKIESAGSFATFGKFNNFIQPGISVESIGLVRLPLSQADAYALIQISQQAPFGRGTETLVDVSIRKTWEIAGAKVQFLNKEWQYHIDEVVEEVTNELGIAGGSQDIRADFYKMLLYEEGAMFKAHKE